MGCTPLSSNMSILAYLHSFKHVALREAPHHANHPAMYHILYSIPTQRCSGKSGRTDGRTVRLLYASQTSFGGIQIMILIFGPAQGILVISTSYSARLKIKIIAPSLHFYRNWCMLATNTLASLCIYTGLPVHLLLVPKSHTMAHLWSQKIHNFKDNSHCFHFPVSIH